METIHNTANEPNYILADYYPLQKLIAFFGTYFNYSRNDNSIGVWKIKYKSTKNQ